MNCYSCQKQKNELHPKKSDILDGVTVLMCQSCIDQKLEPRWIIVLGGRTLGPESVRDYVIKKRYIGAEIFANELIS
jgi:coenzyme F420-reducing hydrogenase gamma subunit